MDVYNAFVAPTTCEAACHAMFTAPAARNLLVARGNTLQIFQITKLNPYMRRKPLMETHKKGRRGRGKRKGDTAEPENDPQTSAALAAPAAPVAQFEAVAPPKSHSLTLLAEYTIGGRILHMHAYRAHDALVDYVVISTEYARLSVIKWDSALHCIATVSLHNYENVLEALVAGDLHKSPVLHRWDPNGLCDLVAAEDILAFLPFKRPDPTGPVEESAQETPKLKSILSKEKKSGKKKTVQIVTPDEEEARNIVQSVNVRSPKRHSRAHYNESFILNASNLHSNLKNILDVQFLHGYSDPTIAVLYAPETQSCAAYLPKARDNLCVMVLSLNLETQKASTIMEIPNLPYDLDAIVPLTAPVNGFVLVGANEVIHINSLGSTKGISVNEYFEKTSSMILTNQASLNLRLENSQLCHITGTNEALLVTEKGKFYTLVFDEIGGISNLNRIVANEASTYAPVAVHSVTSITQVAGFNMLFLTCTGSDSVLIEYVPLTSSEKAVAVAAAASLAPASKAPAAPLADINEDDDSWLYNDEQQNDLVDSTLSSLSTSKFVLVDTLINIGPCKDFSLGYLSTQPKIKQLPNANFKENAIVASTGLDHCSGISILNPTIIPELKDRLKLTAATRLWTLDDHSGQSKFIVSTDLQSNTTDIYTVKEYQLAQGNYDRKSYTIQFGSVHTQFGIKPIQITPHKITVYNMAFNITVSNSYEKVINYAQIFDHYILVITTTGELDILYYNEDEKTLDKIDLPALLNFQIITNGWISQSSILSSKSKKRDSEGDLKQGETLDDDVVFWLVTADNRLLTFQKNHLEKVFEFKDVHNLPLYLELEAMDPSYEADVDPTLKQVMFTSLGDEFHKKDYLLLLTFGGEIIIYETYFDLTQNSVKLIKSNASFGFPVTGAPENSYKYATNIERMMFKINDVGGKHTILVSGRMSFLITMESNSCPRMFKFTSKPMLSFARMSTSDCSSGIVCLDDVMHIRSFQMDATWNLSNLVPIKKVIIGETVDKVQYNEQSNVYIVSTMKSEPYKPLDEDGEVMGAWNKEAKLQGQINRGAVRLISTDNWSVIDTVELKENEVCISLEMMNNMVVSDNQLGILQLKVTNMRKSRLFVGTGIYGNEDLPTNGSWKLYEIVRVNPSPGRPETIWKLRQDGGEECMRGPVLSACMVSGRFGVVQGQRMLVRTIKDDGSVVPVAFTDTSLCSRRIKAFENLVIVGDTFQGVEMFGFDADPYRMIPLSKDERGGNVNECDFIAYDKRLFIVSSDDEGKITLMEYDPYNVESTKGQRLIHKTGFNPHLFTTKMMCVSRRRSIFSMVTTLPFRKEFDLGSEVIASTVEGGFYRITPVADYQHRRLNLIQTFVNDNRPQWLGLGLDGNKGSIVEMRHIRRFLALDETIKKKTAGKLGKTALVEVYRDIIGVQ